MANTATPAAPPPTMPRFSHTTKRGFAAASFCLGLWGTLTFWWYPFGLVAAAIGFTLAVFSLAAVSKRLFYLTAAGFAAAVASAVGLYVGLVPFMRSVGERAFGPSAGAVLTNPLVLVPLLFVLVFAAISVVTLPVKRWGQDPDCQRLAWLGAFFGATGVSMAVAAYRYVQLAFEGSPPVFLTAIWPF